MVEANKDLGRISFFDLGQTPTTETYQVIPTAYTRMNEGLALTAELV
jgi:hypothetical protein